MCCPFSHKTKISLLRRLKLVCFIYSVTRGPGGAEFVTEELFFGNRILVYVDSLFFFLPFSSKSQAETARANTSTTHEDWPALREHLQQDHSKPESQAILIKAWKNYVATSFEQPAAAAAGSPSRAASSVPTEVSFFYLVDDDNVEALNVLPPDDT